jgi:hypothetical protein
MLSVAGGQHTGQDQSARHSGHPLITLSVEGGQHELCTSLLRCRYPRLTLPALRLPPDELLGAVVERPS